MDPATWRIRVRAAMLHWHPELTSRPSPMKNFVRALVVVVGLTSCARAAERPARAYQARTRRITVTTVPLLVKEEEGVLPFLKKDFARGGVLEGKEVYAFSPSSITVVEGDTVRFTLINPEDDDHSFVLPDFAAAMPPQKTIEATYVAKHAGIFTILCAVPSHLPMMSGQLVVLPAATMAGADPLAGGAALK